jgi:hypothetical protein
VQGPQGVLRVHATSGSTTAEWTTAGAAIVTALAAILTALAAACALLGAVYTIKDNRRTARQRVTHESVARLAAPELIESKAVLSSFLRGGLQPPNIPNVTWATMDEQGRRDAMWEHLSDASSIEDRRTVLRILAFPNMLEGLACMYNHGLLDRMIVKTRVEDEATNFWYLTKGWVAKLRLDGESKVYEDLEAMIDDLAKLDRSTGSHW